MNNLYPNLYAYSSGKAFIFLACLFGFFARQKQNARPCNEELGLAAYANYPVGAAVDLSLLNYDTTYQIIAIKQFNSFTPENIFKAAYLHPEPNAFNWNEADQLADFCQRYNKRLHGHTLIWHEQLPPWIWNFEGNADAWEQLMKTHIQTIMTHFKGKVKAWDLFNEAFSEDGTLRNTVWMQHIGATYIEKACLFAREADPGALLFYNDYNLESNPAKRNGVISFFNHLRDRGIAIDGIGVQMHISLVYPDASQIADAFKVISDNGYKIHVSELDISVNPEGRYIGPDQELFKKQANLLGQLILHYNQLPAKNQYGITFWGISDKTSWIRSSFHRIDYPLLYDDEYKPKPAYCKLKDIL